MSIEERVRRALHHHAEGIEPEGGSWERVQRRADEARRRRGWATGATGAVAAAVVLVMAVASFGGDGQVVRTGPAAPTIVTGPPPPDGPPPTSDRGAPTVVPGLWPFNTVRELETYRHGLGTGYDDPVEVTRAFATEYLGMVDPSVGEPMASDVAGIVKIVLTPRRESGRQPVLPGSMDTVVELGSLGAFNLRDRDQASGPWNVLSTTSSNVRLDGDPFRNGVRSPIAISGEATAYEGTIQVAVRQAGMGAGEALGRDFVTAGTLGDFGPFTTEIAFDPPRAEGFGALVLYTESAVDGSTLEATVVGLNFGAGPIGPSEAERIDRTPVPDGTEVTVFFLQGEELVPVTRSVPATTAVLRAALEQLMAGPTEGERAVGFRSMFQPDAAGKLAGVTIDGEGKVVVDFTPSVVSGGATTSAGSTLLLEQLNATVFQFPTVASVEYRTGGSCEDFFMAMERLCEVIERPGG